MRPFPTFSVQNFATDGALPPASTKVAGAAVSTPDDPVIARREQARRLAARGQAVGYGLIGLAIAAFVFGLAIEFTSAVTVVVIGSLAASTLVLLPAIVLGYAVRAAEREERAGEK